MCSRFFIDDTTLTDLDGVTAHVFRPSAASAPHDVYPGQMAPVAAAQEGTIAVLEMRWGFPQHTGKGLLINARSETVLEKKTFRDSAFSRRCVIPARHFYEWDARKEKVTFFQEDRSTLYLAGIFDIFDGERRFVILTTQAGPSVAPVHHRMPLLLAQEEVVPWIRDPAPPGHLLTKTPPPLSHMRDVEQLSLFDDDL